MNIFEPYIESIADKAVLHLKLSLKDRIGSILVARILPILIIIIVFISLITELITTSGIVISGIVFLLLSTIIVLNAGVGSEIYFKSGELEIDSLRLFWKKKVTVSLSDIDYIELEIFEESLPHSAFYRLILKNGKRILLLKFSDIKSNERVSQLNLKLAEITQLKIVSTKLKNIS